MQVGQPWYWALEWPAQDAARRSCRDAWPSATRFAQGWSSRSAADSQVSDRETLSSPSLRSVAHCPSVPVVARFGFGCQLVPASCADNVDALALAVRVIAGCGEVRLGSFGGWAGRRVGGGSSRDSLLAAAQSKLNVAGEGLSSNGHTQRPKMFVIVLSSSTNGWLRTLRLVFCRLPFAVAEVDEDANRSTRGVRIRSACLGQ